MTDLLSFLLTAPPDPLPIASPADLWQASRDRAAVFASPIDRAVAGGFLADRLGYAFAAGYGAALHALVKGGLPDDRAAAFCATEEGGAHPRAIRTILADEGGKLTLRGKKRWATLAPSASELLIVASVGMGEGSRNKLCVVRVSASAPGVTIIAMPPPPFAPEIPHAEVLLSGANVSEGDVLPGDGYDDYLKPFRTIEDIHVQGAWLGYLVGVGRRSGWPKPAIERLVAAVVAVRSIAERDPKSPVTHVALAGLLEEGRSIEAATRDLWGLVGEEERARWARDQGLLSVAGKVREARRERAWQTLEGPRNEAD
ncbi:MAG: acyl-CoA dehydrogenase family protein [Polyangiaceae bacterium]|nr:acyl-CoA dehydrogenase family protein [Polyangiaceae bacterium]